MRSHEGVVESEELGVEDALYQCAELFLIDSKRSVPSAPQVFLAFVPCASVTLDYGTGRRRSRSVSGSGETRP
jgi:hypothetical protein